MNRMYSHGSLHHKSDSDDWKSHWNMQKKLAFAVAYTIRPEQPAQCACAHLHSVANWWPVSETLVNAHIIGG